MAEHSRNQPLTYIEVLRDIFELIKNHRFIAI